MIPSKSIGSYPVKQSTPREPLRTFGEMAKEFGLSVAQLRGHFSRSKTPIPRPEFLHDSATGRASWYRPSPMRAWWKAHQAELQKV